MPKEENTEALFCQTLHLNKAGTSRLQWKLCAAKLDIGVALILSKATSTILGDTRVLSLELTTPHGKLQNNNEKSLVAKRNNL